MGRSAPEPEGQDRDLGRCLRRLRLARNITLATFARRIGVNCADVQSYEDGRSRIPVRVLRRAAEVLDVHKTDLFRADAMPDADPLPTLH